MILISSAQPWECFATLHYRLSSRWDSVDTYRDRLYELKLPRNFHLVVEGFNARYPQIVKLLLIVRRTIAITTTARIFQHTVIDVNSLTTANWCSLWENRKALCDPHHWWWWLQMVVFMVFLRSAAAAIKTVIVFNSMWLINRTGISPDVHFWKKLSSPRIYMWFLHQTWESWDCSLFSSNGVNWRFCCRALRAVVSEWWWQS